MNIEAGDSFTNPHSTSRSPRQTFNGNMSQKQTLSDGEKRGFFIALFIEHLQLHRYCKVKEEEDKDIRLSL